MEARATLAEFYEFLFNRPKLAADLLMDGIAFMEKMDTGQQMSYIQRLFAVCSRNQLEDKIIESSELINYHHLDFTPEQQALIAYHVATAYRNCGKPRTARTVIDKNNLKRFSEGLVLEAQLSWDAGEEDIAVSLLTNGLNRYKQNRPVFEKLIYLLREKGSIDKARQYSFLYSLSHAEAYQAHLSIISHFYKYEPYKNTKISQHIDEFLSLFAKDPNAIRQLAILSSRHGDTQNVKRALTPLMSLTEDLNNVLFQFIIIESDIRAKHYRLALESIRKIELDFNENNPLNPDSKSILHSLKTAIYHGLGLQPEMEVEITALLDSSVIKIDRYLAVAYLFLEVDAPKIALRIINHCNETRKNYNSNVNEALVAIHLKAENAERLIPILTEAMENRRLPNKLLTKSYQLLSSDTNIHLHNRLQVLKKIQSCFSNDYLFADQKNQE